VRGRDLALAAAVAVVAGCGSSAADVAPRPVRIVAGHDGFPAPPQGAVVFSRELGPEVLALGVVPGDNRVVLQASVVGGQGRGVGGLAVTFDVDGRTERGHACGPGCYHATVTTDGDPRTIDVAVRKAHWHVALPRDWPPRDARALVARAASVWRSLHSLTFVEQLASDERHGITTTWRIEAPDRVAYQVHGGWGGVIVGGRRWDRAPGATTWKESEQTRLHQPTPAWVSAVDAHVLGRITFRGRPAWHISFFDPGTPAWFELVLDRQTLQTLETQMNTTAHFMHDVYGSFDTTVPIRPPR
jgi:hypothetical protein